MRKILLYAALISLLCFQITHGQQGKADSQPNQQKSEGSPSPSPPNSYPQIDNKAEAERKAHQAERDAKDDAFREDQARQNRFIANATFWMTIFAGVNLLVAILYAVFAGFTWVAVKKQARHAEETVGKMSDQLAAIKNQEEHLSAQAAAAKEAADMAKGQLVAMQHQEQAQFKALEQNAQSIKLAEENRIFAEKSFIYEQRAYVVAKIRDTGQRDEALQFRLRIQNGGNTPANNVRVSYASGLRDTPPWSVEESLMSDAPEKVVVFDVGCDKSESLGVIAPRGSYHVISTPETFFESEGNLRKFEEGTLNFYCWGRIVYEDMFNEPRHTDFCFVLSQNHPEGYPGEYGNEVF